MNEWISVKDRLPELTSDNVSEDVLIAVQYGYDSPDDRTVISVGYLADDAGDGKLVWFGNMPHSCDQIGGPTKKSESEKKDHVTHWMPLPKLPKESAKDKVVKIEKQIIDLTGQLDHVSNQLDRIADDMDDIKNILED